MEERINTIVKQFNILQGKRNQIQEMLLEVKDAYDKLQRKIKNVEESQTIFQLVAKQTQQQIEYHLSDIVTVALQSVFDYPYEFKVEFVEKRGKTECELWLVDKEQKIKPLDASGGGVVDIISLALRIALWNIKKPKSRSVIILDEPTKFVSQDLRDKVAELFTLLSKKLNLQFIIVTHIDELKECGDKIFSVTKNSKGISTIIQEE